MPSREQRVRVWRGELKKTTGGLTKDDLVKNRKGKIVSRRKSRQAADQNNLGEWLRNKGDRFQDMPQAHAAKGLKAIKPKPPKKAPEPKPKRVPPALPRGPGRSKIPGHPAKQPAAVKPKPKPKPVAVKPKPKPKPVAVKPKPKPKPKPVAVDPALIPPKIDKRLKKKPIPKKKKLDFGFGPIDLTGGRLRKVTQKQLDRAKKKPIPRRAKKKRTRRKPSMGLMV